MKGKLIPLINRMGKSIKFYFITLMMVSVSSSFAEMNYVIRHFSPNGQLMIELQLPEQENKNRERKLTTRAKSLGLTEQVKSPVCGSQALEKDVNDFWVIPPDCTKVNWSVTPFLYEDGKWDVSEQLTASLKEAEWILFSEPTSILRLVDYQHEDSLITANKGISLLGAIEKGQYFALPNEDEAPEFFIVGKHPLNVTKSDIGSLLITYFDDNKTRVQDYHLDEWHEKAIRYLSTLFPTMNQLSQNNRTLMVLWMGVNEKFGHIGGAAGAHSFVANYVFGEKENQMINRIRTMLVIVHENFHQLVDRLRDSGSRQALWVEESIAQYYSLKALEKSFSKEKIQRIYSDFINTTLSREHGLIAIQRQFEQGNHHVYPLFYSQGATFWFELDALIQRKSNNALSLDSFLSELLLEQSDIIEEYQLPQRFISKIMALGGNETQNILTRFVIDKDK